VVKQATGCLASAWARLAAEVGDANATLILENEWECKIPEKVIEAGLLQKARFAHIEVNGYLRNRQLTNDAPFR